jgi:WD40 repeat protein
MFAAGTSFDGRRAFASDTAGHLFELLPSGGSKPVFATGLGNRAILPAADNDLLLLVAATHVASYRLSTGAFHVRAAADGVALGGGAWHGTGPAYAALGDRSVAKFDVPADGPPVRDSAFTVDTSDARCVAIAPDGRTIAVGTNSGAVLLCDATTGAILRRLSVRHAVWSIAFARDGSRLFVGERAGRIHEFRATDGREGPVRSAMVPEPVWALGAGPDGLLIANVGHSVHTFDVGRSAVAGGAALPQATRPEATRPQASLPQDSLPLATWGLTPEPLPEAPKAVVMRDHRTVRAVCSDGVVRDLDLGRGRWEPLAGGALGSLTVAGFTPDGRAVASLHGAVLAITELDTGARLEIGSSESQSGRTVRAVWSADATRLAVVGADVVRVYTRAGALEAQLPIQTREYAKVTWYAPDRFVVLSGVQDVYDCVLEDGFIRSTTHRCPSTVDPIHSGGRWVLPALNGGIVVSLPGGIAALGTSPDDFRFTLNRHRDHAMCAAVSPDGTLLASGGADGTVRLWSLDDGAPITVFNVHPGEQGRALLWLPDGSGIVSIGNFGEVRLLDSVPLANRLAADAAMPKNAAGASPAAASTAGPVTSRR